MSIFYSGIGSRETPQDVLELMEALGALYARRGYILRSGGAGGADSAFERGCDSAEGKKAIFIPWRGFSGRSGPDIHVGVTPLALEIASKFHPAWALCSYGAKKLHARNVYQVLGTDPAVPVLSRFVMCWTPNARSGGGTGQAIRIAQHYGVPVYDLADPLVRAKAEAALATA